MKKKGVYIIIIVVVIALIFLGVNFLFNASKSDSKLGGLLKNIGLFSTSSDGGDCSSPDWICDDCNDDDCGECSYCGEDGSCQDEDPYTCCATGCITAPASNDCAPLPTQPQRQACVDDVMQEYADCLDNCKDAARDGGGSSPDYN